MAGTGKKWAMGCGIGCGLMIIILGGIGACSYVGIKKFKDQAEGLDATYEQVQTRFGDPSDFVPSPDGTISPERVEAFLTIRDDMEPVRTSMSDMLQTLDGDASWLAKAQAGFKLVPGILSYIGERNKVLLANDMGVGEYQHIYALSYFVLLVKDPSDGPGFVITGDNDESENSGVNWGFNSDSKGVHKKRATRVRTFVNDVQVVVLANQLEAYKATLPVGTDLAADSWGSALEAELQAMKLETLRFPWEEGLPEPIRTSLEPYRDRLDQSYDAMTSTIEMGLTEDD